MGNRYVAVPTREDRFFNYHVVDTHNNDFPVAGFTQFREAETDAKRRNDLIALSCCRTSLATRGFEHDITCENFVVKY